LKPDKEGGVPQAADRRELQLPQLPKVLRDQGRIDRAGGPAGAALLSRMKTEHLPRQARDKHN
jgi:hypothetical protein